MAVFSFNRIGRPFELASPVMIDQQIACQLAQPDGKRSFPGAKTLQRPEHPEKHLLRQVLGFLARSGKTVTDGVDAARMRLDKVLPGGFLAAETPLHEIKVLIQGKSPTLLEQSRGGQRPRRANLSDCGERCHDLFASTLQNEELSWEVRFTFYKAAGSR
jgi:hypothetical protein